MKILSSKKYRILRILTNFSPFAAHTKDMQVSSVFCGDSEIYASNGLPPNK